MMTTESILTEMEACKQICIECQTTCIDTLKYCKSQGGKYIGYDYDVHDAGLCGNVHDVRQHD